MAASVSEQKVPDEKELVKKIRGSADRDHVVQTTLQTNEQVIARVTDGIYRQPASALRELISNAYDADATRVVIKTDAPRFNRITVEDDGSGMSPEALAHVLYNIGGSAKRTDLGEGLGITARDSALKSPKGRRLIGKIGIGLFSVSQLTQSFQIITKTKGDGYRTVATVSLRQFTDSEVASSGGEKRFESGKVTIWREKATDKAAHGTTIVLSAIRPQAKDTLQSRDIWSTIEHNERAAPEEEKQSIEPPRFHIGRVDSTGRLLKRTASIPWATSDRPDVAFEKLVDCVWAELDHANPNPKLERLFDYYLRMVWQLGLAIPLPYIDGHLFDMPASGWAHTFHLSNRPRGTAELVQVQRQTIRRALGLSDPREAVGTFDVLVDGLQLARPIKFRDRPTSSHALKHPLVFVGKCDEHFEKILPELSGGRLQFEAYLFWSPKIAPTEHQGSLIRIHGASGTLFDPTFMRYQISELTRLRQITCEIFVSEGLDSALNIDRESFNNAHPHAVYITRWLHGALRQLATAQKRAAGEVRAVTRQEETGERVGALQKIASDIWTERTKDSASTPPSVVIQDDDKPTGRQSDTYVFGRSTVTTRRWEPKGAKEKATAAILEEKLKAIVQVLASFDLLDGLTRKEQAQLLSAIYKILEEREE